MKSTKVLVPTKGQDLLVFAQDYSFDSPTAAATAVTASSVNGRDKWTVEGTGQSYKEWEAVRLSKINA
ncbi:MAG: DUF4357 domain-containing protein [Deltaproteobacteria bacterium]|nr:DUF4357 domain-containing protein [Deltaproteobacteria bacterium]